jgi:hypothetical protein
LLKLSRIVCLLRIVAGDYAGLAGGHIPEAAVASLLLDNDPTFQPSESKA